MTYFLEVVLLRRKLLGYLRGTLPVRPIGDSSCQDPRAEVPPKYLFVFPLFPPSPHGPSLLVNIDPGRFFTFILIYESFTNQYIHFILKSDSSNYITVPQTEIHEKNLSTHRVLRPQYYLPKSSQPQFSSPIVD